MAEVNDIKSINIKSINNNININSSKRKNDFELNWGLLLDDPSDDHTPELVITSSEKSKSPRQTHQRHDEYQNKTDTELHHAISKYKRHILTIGPNCKDNGEKLKATLRRCEAELERRNKITANKDRLKREETIQLSDQSDDVASCGKDTKDQKSLAKSKFAAIFSKKIDENESAMNTFEKETSFINPRQGRKASQNGRLSNRGRTGLQSSSRSKQFQCPSTLADNRKHKVSNSDKKVYRPATSIQKIFTNRTPAPDEDQPLTNLKPKPCSPYHLVDEDIEDPCVSNTTLYAEKLSDCMKDVKVYYPSRDDRDPVEVVYADMECLAPEACLSSVIMNFYIRYLQQSSPENTTCNYHFFNTYFYNKLQKLNYRKDSFLKFRKWWKGVNIFEKAYILLPVHESAHWSLGIICIPTMEDELGPIVLHLDSLGLHDSSLIFDKIRRFVKEEWSYLRNSEDLLFNDEIWENIERRIINRKVQVPQQRNAYDCGLFVLYYMERFIKEAPERLTERDLSMFGKQWFLPEEASNLRVRIHNLLVQEFKIAKDKEPILSP